MPRRTVSLVNGQYYHVFNRSINKEPIFVRNRDCRRALETFSYYRFLNTPVRLSYYLSLGPTRRQEIVRSLGENATTFIDIITYAFMPNHFHFLLRQSVENGISRFLSLFQNSYSRYFTTKYERMGHLFQGQFRVVRIEDEEQLVHVNRYIHLNPYTSFVVKSFEELELYPYSSFPEYLNRHLKSICSKEIILSRFPSLQSYRQFVFDQADYQRQLDRIKHLILK